MRIALIEAQDPERQGQLFMPLGLGYIAAWLKKFSPEHEVLITNNLQEAADFSPQLAGISAVTPNFPHASKAAAFLRSELNIPIVLGGPHITSLPESLPEDFAAGVIGEGEETLADIIKALEANGNLETSAIGEISGIAFKHNGKIITTSPRPPLKSLDVLPFPLRPWAQPHIPQWSFSSRGCPFRCSFCSSGLLKGTYRMHSASYVIDELNSLISQYSINMHIFMDDLFASGQKRLIAMKEEMQRLAAPLDFTATVRADLASPETCRLLADLNVKFAHVGLESGSDRILSFLKNKTTSVKMNQNAINRLSECGIIPIGSFIIGSPQEEERDYQATYNFIKNNLQKGLLGGFTFGPLVAFPGTKVWNYAIENKIIDATNIDWRLLDIDLRSFDPNRYILLTKVTRAKFNYWFKKFYELWQESMA